MTGPDLELAGWIRAVHSGLASRAGELTGARWGPLTVRHRTTRPGWFGDFDLAWAAPLRFPGPGTPDVDVISAAFCDLPPQVQVPAIKRGELGAQGEVHRLGTTSTRLAWREQAGEVLAWDPGTGAALLLRASAPTGYERVSPMRWLVHWAVVRAGGFLIHGACVGRAGPAGERGVLLLGNAGDGKSTTTLECLNNGWVTCGDDAVAVFPDERGWHARAVYAAVKTKLSHQVPPPLDLGQETPATVTWQVGGTKRVHLLTSTDADMICDRIDLDALVFLNPAAPTEAPVHPITPAAARNLAAPSTMFPMPFDRQLVLARIGSMTAEIPAFSLPRRRTLAASVADVAALAQSAQPRVSVVMPVYGGQPYIGAAISSILAQSVGHFQVVVVDDGSPDDSIAVVESMRQDLQAGGHQLVIIRSAVNRGIGWARSAGLGAAGEELVAFLDQDDTWPAHRTACLLTALRRAGAPMAAGRMAYTDVMPGRHRPWVRQDWFDGDHPGTVMGAILCRREVLDTVGGPDAGIRTADDTDWFLRVRDAGVQVAQATQVVLVRKVHDRNQSRLGPTDRSEMLAAIRAHLQRRNAAGSLPGAP